MRLGARDLPVRRDQVTVGRRSNRANSFQHRDLGQRYKVIGYVLNILISRFYFLYQTHSPFLFRDLRPCRLGQHRISVMDSILRLPPVNSKVGAAPVQPTSAPARQTAARYRPSPHDAVGRAPFRRQLGNIFSSNAGRPRPAAPSSRLSRRNVLKKGCNSRSLPREHPRLNGNTVP